MLELEGTNKNAVIIMATKTKAPIENPDMGLYFRDKREQITQKAIDARIPAMIMAKKMLCLVITGTRSQCQAGQAADREKERALPPGNRLKPESDL